MNKKIKIGAGLIMGVVLILILVLVRGDNTSKTKSFKGVENQPRDAINTKSEVVKNPDEVAKINVDYGEGPKEKIQINFTWEQDGIKYSDALYFTPEEYAKLSPADIEKMEKERFDNWVKLVNEQSKK